MKLHFDIILEKLKIKNITPVAPIDKNTRFNGIRYHTPEMEIKSDYLYIYTDKNYNLPGFLASDNSTALSCLEQVQTIFDEYNNWYERLTSSILKQEPLQKILDIAVEVLRNPIALLDSSFVTILHAGNIPNDVNGSVWDSILHKGYFSLEDYSNSLRNMILNNIQCRKPLLYDSGYPNGEVHVTAPLFRNGQIVAYIGCTDINGAFSSGQLLLLEIIQHTLEIAFENSNKYQIASEEDSYYIKRLVQGFNVEPEPLMYFLNQKKWKINDQYMIMSLQRKDQSVFEEFEKQQYSFRIKLLLPDSILSLWDNRIVIILHNPKVQFDIVTQQNFSDFIKSLDLKCGISAEFTDFSNLRYAYIQSKLALDQIQNDPKKHIRYFLSSFQNLILDTLYSSTNIKAFCHPKLLEYWQSKGEVSEEIFKTIYTFLTFGGNLTLTANELNIHRNTLLYRIEKIQDLFQIDLKKLDSDQRFHLLFSCSVISYLAAKLRML